MPKPGRDMYCAVSRSSSRYGFCACSRQQALKSGCMSAHAACYGSAHSPLHSVLERPHDIAL